MNKKIWNALTGMIAVAGIATAVNIDVTSDITTSTVWTSNNVYNLTTQIYVRPGATLTIQPGTLVQTDTADKGSLAVCRGAKIYANGTKDAPVIMTSTADSLTSWHAGANEWGNLTLMGNGLISASHYKGSPISVLGVTNTKNPTGLNRAVMEGLAAPSTNAADVELVVYGGADDNDDSGSLRHLSIRYGGKVLGLSNELNGLSMGGIGRGTDVEYIEIMNNVDDGVEVWGGTVNFKYLSIWNVGDDSFDCDQGWRGKAQFGLIVQGYSVNAKQGSGVGDNAIEIDGAEQADAQPVTTVKIANFTVIGTLDADHATAWRDNARVQFHNSIFMDIGERLVAFDCFDTDGGLGYGYNGTLSWTGTWATAYNNYPTNNWVSDVYASQAEMYTAQNSGNLSEMRGCLTYRSSSTDYPGSSKDMAFAGAATYSQTDTGLYGTAQTAYPVGAFNGTYSSPLSNTNLDNIVSVSSPIQGLTRGAIFTTGFDGGLDIQPVTNINPCAANDALTVASPETADGFFVAAPYRGAFSPNYNWLAGWTAVDAYGMTDTSMNTNAPTSAIAIGAVVSFQSENGVAYGVERANAAGGSYAEVATIYGDGSYKTYVDDELSTKAFYRVVVK